MITDHIQFIKCIFNLDVYKIHHSRFFHIFYERQSPLLYFIYTLTLIKIVTVSMRILIVIQFRNWGNRDKRIRVYHTEKLGVSNARNFGITASGGKWICFVDADDWLETSAIKMMASFAEKENIDLAYYDFFYNTQSKEIADSHFIYESKHLFSECERKDLLSDCINKASFARSGRNANSGVPWGKLYRRELVVKNKISFPFGIKRMQDMIFNLQVISKAERICYFPIGVYHYRGNQNSVSYRYSPDFDETMKKILYELRLFIQMNDAYYLEDDFNVKKIKLFLEWIRLSVVPTERSKSMSMNIMDMRTMADELEIKEATQKLRPDKLSMTQYIGGILTKFGLWHLLFAYYSLGRYVKYKRIYKEETDDGDKRPRKNR